MEFKLYLQAIGLTGPGFSSWDQFCEQVDANYFPLQTFMIPPVTSLPATERRRLTPTIKLALATAQMAVDQINIADAGIASIFASSNGDTAIMDYLGETLAMADRPISPTKFHNSLLNAPSGYWAISQQCRQQTIAITAGENTFAAGLMEAAMYCSVEQKPILLVAYDVEAPQTLKKYINIEAGFAVALVLSPQRSDATIAEFILSLADNKSNQPIENANLEKLIQQNPIAKALHLLLPLVTNNTEPVYLDYLPEQSLKVEVKVKNEMIS